MELGAQAVEVVVALYALTAASKLWKGTPQYWKSLDPKNAALLLVEFGFDSDQELEVIEKEGRVRFTRC